MIQRLRATSRTTDSFADCKTADDLWNHRDEAREVINSISPYLRAVQLLARGGQITDEYRVGIAVCRDGQEIGRYMSRNDPETGQIVTIENCFQDEEPHMAIAMQEQDILRLVQGRDRIAMLGYVPLLGYIPKIQPLAGYRDLFREVAKMVPRLLRTR